MLSASNPASHRTVVIQVAPSSSLYESVERPKSPVPASHRTAVLTLAPSSSLYESVEQPKSPLPAKLRSNTLLVRGSTSRNGSKLVTSPGGGTAVHVGG